MKKLLLLLSSISLTSFAQGDFKKHMDSGNQKYKIKSYNLAIPDYDNAIKLVSVDIDKMIAAKTQISEDKKYMLEPYVKRASCFYFAGNASLMKGDLEKVAALDSTNPDAKALRAYDKFKSGDKVKGCMGMQTQARKGSAIAKQVFDECFCWSEGVNMAKEATSKNNLRKYDEALPLAETALEILPDSGYIYAEKGKALIGLKKNEEAVKALRIGASLNKSNYKIYYQLGIAYNNLEKTDSAYIFLNTAATLSRNMYEIIFMRAEIAERLEQWNAAVFDLQNCIKQKPDNGDLYYRIALIKHNHQDDLLGACEYYNGASARGNEEAKEMATNCNNQKYMKSHLKKADK
ncbi:MAG: tetratricopeptide repeat protein [Bacteroidia bacterium]